MTKRDSVRRPCSDLIRRAFAFLLFALLGNAVATAALADDSYPNHPIRVVVNFPAGGGVDVVGRLVAEALTEAFHRPAYVDNKGGAGGIIGANVVAKSPGDGYTLLVSSSGALDTNPQLVTDPPFSTLKDLRPISELVLVPNILLTKASFPASNAKEFIEYVKSHPTQTTFASSGIGSSAHISGEMLNYLLHISSVHVPYSGTSAIYPDLVAGRVDFMFDGGAGLPFVGTGQLKLLATTSKERIALFPNTPTMIESGVSGFILESRHSVLVPASTPPDIVEKINKAVVAYFKQPDVQAKLKAQSLEVVGNSAQEAEADFQANYKRNATFLRSIGLTPH